MNSDVRASDGDVFEGQPLGATRELADGVFAVNAAFWGFPNVVHLLRSGDALALIDTGIAETPAVAIEPVVLAHGGWGRVELVLGTHAHLDHIGGNGWIRARATQARFAVGAQDTGWAEDGDRHYDELYCRSAPGDWRPDQGSETIIRWGIGDGVPIDLPLEGGEVVVFGDGREIDTIHLGAHTPGQTMYQDRATSLAFSGDAVQGAGILNARSKERDFPMYRSVEDYLHSLEIIRALRPALLCTAHAGMHPAADIDSFIAAAVAWTEGFDRVLLTILAGLADADVEEVVPLIDAAMPGYALGLQIRVTAREHLASLARRGLVETVGVAPAQRWRLRPNT